MRILKVLKNILLGLYESLKRFPVSIVLSISTGAVLVVISELEPYQNISLRDDLIRLAMVLGLGIFFSLCIKLYYERNKDKNKLKLFLLYIAGAGLLILYYFFLLKKLNMVSTTRYIGTMLVLILGFLYIPYLWGREQYEKYIIKIFTGFFITFIYSVVLFAGLSAILFTVDKLLGIHVASKTYYYTWLFVVFAFASSYFLSGVPGKEKSLEAESYPKLLKILLLYIVMPLIAVYTSILYIYFLKIMFTRQWPVGMVSNLVLWYSIICIGVIFLTAPIRGENRWVNYFSKWLPKIILPILIMMFISMGIRVNAYGITENRYFVVVLGLWASGIMVYFSAARKLRNILIPFTLSIITILSVFGPVSSYSISKYSQNMRLEKILVRNNMLNNGQIQPSDSVSQGDRSEISRILDYFNNNHSFSDVKVLPRNYKIEDMNKVFGFSYENVRYDLPQGYFYFTSKPSGGAVDIRGYDYLIDTRSLYGKSGADTSGIETVYNSETAVLKIKYNGSIVYDKDLKTFIGRLIDKYGANTNDKALSLEDMTLTDENEKVNIKIIFMNISGNRDASSGSVRANGLDFYMLIKIK